MKTEATNETENASTAKSDESKATETKVLRFPLNLFQEHLDKFPKSVAAKAKKVGPEQRGDRTWGPEIPVTQPEIQKIFDVAEAMYKNKDTAKPTKTYAYQLRNAAAKLGGIQIKNVRQYNRKPKEIPVSPTPAVEMHVTMSMPPRDNLVRANTTLDIVRGILRDNGQNSVATMLDSVASDIALPEQSAQQE